MSPPSRPRTHSHLPIALSNWFARGVSVLTQLISLPLLTRHLGPDHYAAYALIMSLVFWFSLTDFGLGNTGQNAVVAARASGQSTSGLVGAILSLSFLAMLFGIGLAIAIHRPLAGFLLGGMTFISSTEGSSLVLIATVCFVVSSVSTVAGKILLAIDRGVLSNLLNAMSSTLCLGTLFFSLGPSPESKELTIAIASFSVPAAILSGLTFAVVALRFGTFTIQHFRAHFPGVVRRARPAWAFAVFAAIVLNVDYLVMSQLLNTSDIAIYSVLFRLYWFSVLIYSGLLSAAWPEITRLSASGNAIQIRSYLRHHLIFGLCLVVATFLAISIFSIPLFNFLLPGHSLGPDRLTLVLFACYAAIRIWTDTFAVGLQALDDYVSLLKWVPIQATVSVFGQIIATTLLGLNGILIGLLLAYALTVSWALPHRLLRRTLGTNGR